MTHTALSATGALRRAAECVLMAFGVPVTRDMPVDAVFLPNEVDDSVVTRNNAAQLWEDGGGDTGAEPLGTNPSTGLPMAGLVDVLGYEWGTLRHSSDD